MYEKNTYAVQMNPQQYPYAANHQMNPQMQNPQQYPFVDHNMINPQIQIMQNQNQPDIIIIG